MSTRVTVTSRGRRAFIESVVSKTLKRLDFKPSTRSGGVIRDVLLHFLALLLGEKLEEGSGNVTTKCKWFRVSGSYIDKMGVRHVYVYCGHPENPMRKKGCPVLCRYETLESGSILESGGIIGSIIGILINFLLGFLIGLLIADFLGIEDEFTRVLVSVLVAGISVLVAPLSVYREQGLEPVREEAEGFRGRSGGVVFHVDKRMLKARLSYRN